jgi:hypothetical protein
MVRTGILALGAALAALAIVPPTANAAAGVAAVRHAATAEQIVVKTGHGHKHNKKAIRKYRKHKKDKKHDRHDWFRWHHR